MIIREPYCHRLRLPRRSHRVEIGNDQQQSVTNHWAHIFMRSQWSRHNTGSTFRALEMFKSGEGTDFVIEVQQDLQQPNDDGPSRKRSRKIDHAEKGIRQQQNFQKEFNVHKCILSANSEVFRAMFQHKNTKECQESRITIKDSTTAAVRHMIQYMYTGQISDDYDREEDALPLLTIAHKYLMKPLVDFNEWILVETLTLENVFERVKYAELLQTNKLKRACANIIRYNLRELKRRPEWIELKKNFPEFSKP